METCIITLQDAQGDIVALSVKHLPAIKAMLANGCTVVRIHRQACSVR